MRNKLTFKVIRSVKREKRSLSSSLMLANNQALVETNLESN